MRKKSKSYTFMSVLQNVSFYFLVSSFLLSSCSVDDDYQNQVSKPNGNPIEFKIGFAKEQGGLRTSVGLDYVSRFNVGDSIGIFAVSNTGAEANELQSTGNYIHNLKLVFQADGTWKPATPIYYPTNAKNLQFYAYYPYNRNVTDPLNMTLAIQTNQSLDDNFAKSDIMRAMSGAIGKGEAVELFFSHLMSLLEVQVTNGSNGAELDALGKVELENVVASINGYNLSSNIGTPQTANKQVIRMNKATGTTNIYRAYVPAHVYSLNDNLRFCFTQDLSTRFNLKTLSLANGFAYKHNITLTTPIKIHRYAVGDYYPYTNINTPEGVVCYIEGDGRTGAIISLDETEVTWILKTAADYQDGFYFMTNTYDGFLNMQLAKNFNSSLSWFPALKWCESKGYGWYLPASEEFARITPRLAEINNRLSNKIRIDGASYYQTSTEMSITDIDLINFADNTYPIQPGAKIGSHYVRAMRKF